VGPVAFVIVFMLIPLGAALLAGGYSAWAALTVGAGVVLAARLWMVVRALRSDAR
jgi:hypothetical protein